MFDVRLYKELGALRIDVAFRTGAGVTALFGPSGAGKTAVLNMIAGISRPDRGRIVIDDTVLFDSDQKIDLPPERRRIGYAFQDARLFPHLSVRANLTYGLRFSRAADRFVSLDQIAGLLGLGPLLGRWPVALSGGEKQRVAIGRALLSNPRLLLLDEPLASLDRTRKSEILPYLDRLKTELKLPMLYVTHSEDEIERLADHVVRVKDSNA